MRVSRLALVLSALLPALAVAAPVVFYQDISSGPGGGGEGDNGAYLTLYGRGFGATRGTSRVTVGGGEVGGYKVWTDTRISVQIGHAATSGEVLVTTADGNARSPDGFTVRPGRVWFVSLTGNDSTCVANDVTRPCRTANHLARDVPAQAGDVIVVRGGTYRASNAAEGWVNSTFARPTVSGTPSAPISLMGYPGEDVVLRMDQAARLFAHYENVSYWTIANFRVIVQNCTPEGIVMLGSPVTPAACNDPTSVSPYARAIRLVGLDIDGQGVGGMCGGSGGDLVEIGTSDSVKVLGVQVHDTSPANASEPTHAIYLSAPQSGTEVGWNRVYNIPHSRALIQLHEDSFGGACWGKDSITDISVHDNEITNVAGQAILLDGGVGAVQIYDNVLTQVGLPTDHRYEDVIALRGAGGRMKARVLHNTIVVDPNAGSAGWIFGVGGAGVAYCPESLEISNNILKVTGVGDTYFGFESWCSSFRPTGSNNVWVGGGAAPAFDVAPVTQDPALDAGLRPTAASPGNGRGATGTGILLDHDGRVRRSPPDIGAWDYAAGTPALPVPANVRLQRRN
ncbi:MAG: hypothetical protein IPI06_03995 [Gammaproteobacteria bacterium]|nr:hypothetical protein [Gammaproteobacteria bacterium]